MSEGSIGYYDSSSVLTELASGSENNVLTMGATLPAWSASASTIITRLESSLASTFVNTALATWTDIDTDQLTLSVPDGVDYIACATCCVNNWNYSSDCYLRFEVDGSGITNTETEVAHNVGHQNAPVTATLFYQGTNTTGGAIDVKIQCYNDGGSFKIYGESLRHSTLWITTFA